ncbi:MFS family permease [Rhodoblastus acidophilus]|uniref:MFS transporter n=1 Tax=Rhodoblastus acidophilus TaxID=1074 RepID=UPI002225025E|nr:MFS transporter [Rhodoblastus acidophilus]MCW2284505.1 MFS family permease [Rhodoblastus acidophilus]MCW2333352.1 MFS family permease [Rhodoblastus acidophilus]
MRPGQAHRSAERGLDWLIFFVADIQTGFGPFVAVFLTSQKWTQVDIGLLLSMGTLVGLFGQIPAGVLVDSVRSTRLVAGVCLVTIGASALVFAAFPIFGVALAARFAHGAASCVLSLALISLALGLDGADRADARLARNAAFASAGSGVTAALMGFVGYQASSRAVFFVAAALVLPALIALWRIRPGELGPASDAARGAPIDSRAFLRALRDLAQKRDLVALCLCLVLFHLANASMLPLAASLVTQRSSQEATLMVAAALLAPQFLAAALAPFVGRGARIWGRRRLLLLGFAALAARGLLFSSITDPVALAAIQALDGISAAVLGVIVPLIIVDLTRDSGHFNLAQALAGSAAGIGGALSTIMAGWLSDHFSAHAAFSTLTVIAILGLAAVALALRETEPEAQRPH